jgi:hypothetical protein
VAGLSGPAAIAPAMVPTPSAPAPAVGAVRPESTTPVVDATAIEATALAPAPAPTSDRAPASFGDTLAARRPAAPARPRPTARSRPEVSPLKAELDGLRRAQELLHQGRPAWAIARLEELDRSGVSAALLEERAATRTIAECTLEHGSAAGNRARLDEFTTLHPGSAHLDQVRASCAGAPRYGAAEGNMAPAQTEN